MKKNLERLCFANGLFNLKKKEPINITQKPSIIPKKLFYEIWNLQKKLNILYFNLAQDLDSYQFTDDMYLFLERIRKKKGKKKIEAFFIRSDYLLDKRFSGTEIVNHYDDNSSEALKEIEKNYIYKQVEINMISQCFVVFGPILNKIHRLYYPETLISESDSNFVTFLSKLKTTFENVYDVSDTVMLMIDDLTDNNSSNYLEKVKLIELCLKENIIIHHVLLDDLENCFKNGNVVYKDQVVSIVYFRYFYNFNHFTKENMIIKEKIELSNAISLPSTEFQIVNSKAFQKILADEKTLSKYIEPELKKHFGEFKEFNEYKGEEGWILKDVNEGGGFIKTNKILDNQNNQSQFLMKKFESPAYKNQFINGPEGIHVINEVSVFGSLIAVDGNIIHNSADGYLVRSKKEASTECGICIGAGGLDSIILK